MQIDKILVRDQVFCTLDSLALWGLEIQAKRDSLAHRSQGLLKPLSHWTATVLRQLATDIASGSQSSLETVASDS